MKHLTILPTFIVLPLVIKTVVLSIIEWPFIQVLLYLQYHTGTPVPLSSGKHTVKYTQGSKIALIHSYLRVPQAAEQVEILIFLMKINIFPYMPIIFVMQGKCLL